MDGNIDKVREATEKLCHQIYDVLPISPALKLLDDGKLYALITAHDEAIRREALQSVRKEIEKWRDDITCCDYDEGYLDGTDSALKTIDASILSAEPAQDDISEIQERVRDEDGLELSRSSIRRMMAQDDGKPEVGDAVVYFPIEARGKAVITQYESWHKKEFGEFIVIRRAAEVKRRLEEAKE